MVLLERESHLSELERALEDARASRGRTALVAGEAGIGKTALIAEFARAAGERARVLWGACEALFTPRPLGPFYDVVHALGGPLAARLEGDTKPVDLFHGLLEAIRKHDQPSLIVLEDVHWADHATLDFLRFVARRIARLPALMVCTYRDEEVGAGHPLTAVLGEIPRADQTTLKLPAFSRSTVERLAREAGRDDADVYRVTGGNPFFVTELMTTGTDALAPNVRQAVLSRARHLTPSARELLDLVSVVPDRLELALLEGPLAADLAALEECAERGMLLIGDEHAGFRHELARMAIEGALSPVKRTRLNRRMLEALARGPVDAGTLTRLAHHAVAARDADAIIRYAPQAARAASERGAHREASVLLAGAAPHAERLEPRARAAFLEQRARAAFVAGRPTDAIAASQSAHALWAEIGDPLARGRNLLFRCEMLFASDLMRRDEARRIAGEALALLEPINAPAELAFARAWQGFLVAPHDPALAMQLDEEVLRASENIPDPATAIEILSRATLLEITLMGRSKPETVERMFALARTYDLDQGMMSAYRSAMQNARYELDGVTGTRIVEEALRFADNRQLDRYLHTLILRLEAAVNAMQLGRREEGERIYAELAGAGGGYWSLRMFITRLRLAPYHLRAGRREGTQWLDEARAVTVPLQPVEAYWFARATVEQAWLAGAEPALREAVHGFAACTWGTHHPWARGEVALWCWIAGELAQAPEGIATPFRQSIEGDFRGAAAAWKARGLPYDEAFALAFGDEDAQREAIRIYDELGATVAADRVRELMRARGLRAIPQGPRAATRANPAGLTERELEVLELLAAGLSNNDIAARLHRSVRTVENHVAAVTGKLGVDGRLAAVAAARERGILE